MSICSSLRFLLTASSIAVLCLSTTTEVNAQRGFRIGNIMQAGGGQGFRLGGPRAGMHFGGGQGASIGTQNFGMRFGNGQGARFGGQQYGMQFGGQQGSQIGQFSTRPTVAPGTYYYGDVRRGYSQPIVNQRYARPQAIQQPINGQAYVQPSQAIVQQPLAYSQPFVSGSPTMIPTVANPTSNVVQTQANFDATAQTPTLSAPMTFEAGNGTQLDIASAPTDPLSLEPVSTEAVTTEPAKSSAPLANEMATTKSTIETATSPEAPGVIRLQHAASANAPMPYKLNGTEFKLAPGESIMMTTGSQWTINFSAGDSYGEREAKLSEAGSYSFEKSSDEGWVLVNDQAEATANPEKPKYETSEVAEMLTSESNNSEAAKTETKQPEVKDAPQAESTDSSGIQLDAPAINADGTSVLKTEVITEETVSPIDIAPPKAPEGDDK
jgi:hypothetical protein